MVEIDLGDRRDIGSHGVGGVQAPAEAGLENHRVDGLFGEVKERHRGHQFEKGRFSEVGGEILRRHADPVQVLGKRGVRDHLVVDLHPLADVDQVRAGIHTDRVPR